MDSNTRNSNKSALHLHITGKVQGVSYRAWTKDQADSLGITGWVRNRTDGSVEACICGEEDAVQKLLKLCENGPPAAQVENIRTKTIDTENHSGFIIKPTV